MIKVSNIQIFFFFVFEILQRKYTDYPSAFGILYILR